jgi:hypothetical protein
MLLNNSNQDEADNLTDDFFLKMPFYTFSPVSIFHLNDVSS